MHDCYSHYREKVTAATSASVPASVPTSVPTSVPPAGSRKKRADSAQDDATNQQNTNTPASNAKFVSEVDLGVTL